ncbi:MAG: hypothetical protein WAU89_17960 [Candidatus Acidiferrales bacterium]
MSITLVQQVGFAAATPTITRTLNGVAAGNTLIVPFNNGGTGGASEVVISDTQSNTWTVAILKVFSTHTMGIAYCTAVGGNTTVTVGNNISQPTVGSLSEWNSGVPGAALGLDQATGANGNSTSPDSGSVTTVNNSELLIGMIFANAGGLSAGSGWTGLTSGSAANLAEYQIVSSTGTYDATATCTTGVWGAVIATFLILPLPIFNTPAGRFNTAGALVGNLLVPIWTATNVSPVTANANTTSDQDLMSIIVPANTLNSVGRTLRVKAKSVYSTPMSSTATITVKVQLGTLTLLTLVTSANAGSITNNGFLVEADITTQTAGSSAKFESSGKLEIDLGAAQSSVASVFVDSNSAVSSTLDITQNQTLQITIAFSAGSASNSATQRQLILGTVN